MNQEKEQGMEQVVQDVTLVDDLSQLTKEQRWEYYKKACETYGLDPITRPFAFIRFENSGKLKLYALRSATDQLRKIHDISVSIVRQENFNGIVYIMTARAKDANGRIDEAVGSVSLCDNYGNFLKPHEISNAIMTCQTKAIRRATLSICGVSMLDETEAWDIPDSVTEEPEEPTSNPTVNNVAPIQEQIGETTENFNIPSELNQQEQSPVDGNPSDTDDNNIRFITGVGVITSIQRINGVDGKEDCHILRISEKTPDNQNVFFDAYAVKQLSKDIEQNKFFECAEVEFKAQNTQKGVLLHSLKMTEQPQLNF